MTLLALKWLHNFHLIYFQRGNKIKEKEKLREPHGRFRCVCHVEFKFSFQFQTILLISGKNTLVIYGKFLLVQECYYKLWRRATWLLNKISVTFEAKIHSMHPQCFIFMVLYLRNFQIS